MSVGRSRADASRSTAKLMARPDARLLVVDDTRERAADGRDVADNFASLPPVLFVFAGRYPRGVILVRLTEARVFPDIFSVCCVISEKTLDREAPRSSCW